MADPQEGASQDESAPVRESMDYDLVIVGGGPGRASSRHPAPSSCCRKALSAY